MEHAHVGIDVSKERLDVHVRPSGESFWVARDGDGLAALITRLQALPIRLVAVEATGGFDTIAAAAIGSAGLPLAVVNPAQVRHFAQALGRRAKTDRVDAEVIARFAEMTRPEPRPLPDAATLAAVRHNPVIRAFRQRFIAAGKAKILAIVACMRKLITILNAIAREQKPWQPA